MCIMHKLACVRSVTNNYKTPFLFPRYTRTVSIACRTAPNNTTLLGTKHVMLITKENLIPTASGYLYDPVENKNESKIARIFVADRTLYANA